MLLLLLFVGDTTPGKLAFMAAHAGGGGGGGVGS
jgi:hypothetical protein